MQSRQEWTPWEVHRKKALDAWKRERILPARNARADTQAWFGRKKQIGAVQTGNVSMLLHLCIRLQSLAQGLAHSRYSLDVSCMNDRDKVHFPRRAQDKTRPRGMRAQPWAGQVKTEASPEPQASGKGVEGVKSTNTGWARCWKPFNVRPRCLYLSIGTTRACFVMLPSAAVIILVSYKDSEGFSNLHNENVEQQNGFLFFSLSPLETEYDWDHQHSLVT